MRGLAWVVLMMMTTACMRAGGAPDLTAAFQRTPAEAVWYRTADRVEVARVVRVTYSGGGDGPAVLTIDEDGRVAIDYRDRACRKLLVGTLLRWSCHGRLVRRQGEDFEAGMWSALVSVGLANLSWMHVRTWGPGEPMDGRALHDLPTEVSLAIGDGGFIRMGFDEVGELRRVRFEHQGDVERDLIVHAVVFDPPLPSDFFTAGGSVSRADPLWTAVRRR